jgi:hypothetical protein
MDLDGSKRIRSVTIRFHPPKSVAHFWNYFSRLKFVKNLNKLLFVIFF